MVYQESVKDYLTNPDWISTVMELQIKEIQSVEILHYSFIPKVWWVLPIQSPIRIR